MRPGVDKLFSTGISDENGELIFLRHSQIKDYLTEEFWWLYECYIKTETYGLPNGGRGWANEPSYMMDGIFTLKFEDNAIEAEQWSKTDERSS